MKNYEAIAKMNLEEMAAMFYLFAKPFFDAFEMTAEDRAKAKESIKGFLNRETGDA